MLENRLMGISIELVLTYHVRALNTRVCESRVRQVFIVRVKHADWLINVSEGVIGSLASGDASIEVFYC